MSGREVLPVGAPNIYYKSGKLDPKVIRPLPQGIRMITGDADAKSPQGGPYRTRIRWNCTSNTIERAEDFFPYIPTCAVGDELTLTVIFPQCWDGENLDAPDHKSHLFHPDETLACPPSHPVSFPEITYNLNYAVTTANGGTTRSTQGWKLSSDSYEVTPERRGGMSAHGDWFMAWDKDVMDTFVRECINKGRDCSDGELGDGTQLSDFVTDPSLLVDDGGAFILRVNGDRVHWLGANERRAISLLFSPRSGAGESDARFRVDRDIGDRDFYSNWLTRDMVGIPSGTIYMRACEVNPQANRCERYSNSVRWNP